MRRLIHKIKKVRQRLLNKQKSYLDLIEYFKNPPKESIEGLNVSPLRYSEEKLNIRSKFIHDLLMRLVDKSSSVIELGCGIGRNINYLYEKGFTNVNGLDINEEAIRMAPTIYPSLKKIHKNLSIGSLEDSLSDYRDEEFEVTFTMCCLMHIHKQVEREVFQSIGRITNKYLITMEIEESIHPTHFPRNYNKVFQDLGFVLLEEYQDQKVIYETFGSDVKVRILSKVST